MRRYFWPYGLTLVGLMVIGLILQLHNLTSYNLYPDSYQNLVVADNLKHQHRLVAPMGAGGQVYPDFFGWTRPLYSLLIALLSLTGLSLVTAGHVVAVTAGVFATLSLFGLVTSVFKSPKMGLVAAGLLAISYSRAVWGGFILTEPLSLLILSLALWSLWANRRQPEGWFTGKDILTGAIFALAILTRYEYALILLPAAFLAGKTWSPKRVLSVITASIYFTAMALVVLRPFTGGLAWVWPQVKTYVLALVVFALVAGALFAFNQRKAKFGALSLWPARVLAALVVIGSLALALRHSLYPALWRFASNEPLLAVLVPIGLIWLLLGKPALRNLGLWLGAGMIIMLSVYHNINPEMDRYVTHLLPLALVAAAYGIKQLFSFKDLRLFFLVLLTILAGVQLAKTWDGLHNKAGGVWFRPGYEESSAKNLNQYINKDEILLTSMPEPYYLFTGLPTQSLTDSPPYIYINPVYDNKTVVVVDDMAMENIFPNFSKILHRRLGAYQTTQYRVNQPLRYKAKILQETMPVKIYAIKLSDLRKNLQH